MVLQLLYLRSRALSSLLRQFGSGMQRPVKGSHLFIQLSSFNTSCFLFDEASEKDGYSEDLNSKEDVGVEKQDQAVENGLGTKEINATSQGIYKAFLLGEAGCSPSQKTLRNGCRVTLFSLGTSGMRNNRKPFEDETPDQYARRSLVQWHRIAIYQFRLGALAMKSVKKGSQVYVEGNIETRVFLDPESNRIKRIQEIAVRQNGRVIFLDQNKGNSWYQTLMQAQRMS